MSRKGDDYSFIQTDPDAILQSIMDMYKEITGKTVSLASPDMLFIRWVQAVLIHAMNRINIAANQNLASRATGDNLDRLGELLYSQNRPGDKPASVQMEFTISGAQDVPVLIPAGTRVSSGDVFFMTERDVYVPIGDTSVEVHAVCMTSGTIGNGLPAGSITNCVDPFPYYESCVNVDESGGGSARPDDDTFYELLVASQDAYSTAGPSGAYAYWAKSVSTEIADVAVNMLTPGQVSIYVLMADGRPAGEEIKRAVLAACADDEIRPLTDQVIMRDPDCVPYDVNVTYYLDEKTTSASDAESRVNEAVSAYNE